MLIYILTIDCLFNILSSHHGDFQCSLSLSFVQKDQKKLAHTLHDTVLRVKSSNLACVYVGFFLCVFYFLWHIFWEINMNCSEN